MPAATVTQMTTPLGERVTTDRTITRDLRASVSARGVDAGSTFGDFLVAAKALGITERTPLASIEFGIASMGNRRLVASFDADGVELREGR